MKFTKDLAAIHAYLCGNGYVIKNPEHQKHKYYYIGLRNTNPVLLKDFQEKFRNTFSIEPIITKSIDRCKIQNKELYYYLTKEYSFYSYEWRLPNLPKENLKSWLRAFFDCEGWVENQPKKSRIIGLECCNETGIISIQNALKRLEITSKVHKRPHRTIWRLTICGLQNLKRYQTGIGFLHPEKKKKLIEAIASYVDYDWAIPDEKQELLKFVSDKGRLRKSRKEMRFFSIRKNNLLKLRKALNRHLGNETQKLKGPYTSGTGSRYYSLIIKMESLISGRKKTRTTA